MMVKENLFASPRIRREISPKFLLKLDPISARAQPEFEPDPKSPALFITLCGKTIFFVSCSN